MLLLHVQTKLYVKINKNIAIINTLTLTLHFTWLYDIMFVQLPLNRNLITHNCLYVILTLHVLTLLEIVWFFFLKKNYIYLCRDDKVTANDIKLDYYK